MISSGVYLDRDDIFLGVLLMVAITWGAFFFGALWQMMKDQTKKKTKKVKQRALTEKEQAEIRLLEKWYNG